MPEKDIKLTFEQSISRMEQIVSILESGEPSLDESLKLFEEAAELCRYCNIRLADAQKKITQYTLAFKENGEKND